MDSLGINNNQRKITRREFAKLLGVAAGTVAGTVAAGGAVFTLSGCDAQDAYDSLTTASGLGQEARTITDQAGRELTIPAKADIKRVYSTSALAQFFLFTLDWEKMGGVNSSFSEEEMQYLPDGLKNLPTLGSLTSNSIDPENLMLEDIQVIFSISAVPLTESNINDADNLQELTNIPVVLIDGSMDKITQAYTFLGECIGSEDRAKELADYCTKILAEVTDAVGDIPEDEKTTFYYAQDVSGLTSKAEGNQHVVAFEVSGAKNVVTSEIADALSSAEVSLEQVIRWDPQTIFAMSYDIDGGADKIIRESEDWASISAVKNNRVYTIPSVPFTWVDQPSAANRFLGIQWITHTLYPDRYKIDMVARVQEFYKLFYQSDIAEATVIEMLGNTYTA